MLDSENILASMPMKKLFFRLAIPAVLAQLVNILYNLVDKMFVGHIEETGAYALAGMGVATPVILCISAIAALVSMGGTPLASIMIGKGDKDSAEKNIGYLYLHVTDSVSYYHGFYALLWRKNSAHVWSRRRHDWLCSQLHENLLPGNCIRPADSWLKRVYHSTR